MSRPELADILERAAARLEPPGAWVQGVLARACDGVPVDSNDPRAASWCLIGALDVETGPDEADLFDEAVDAFGASLAIERSDDENPFYPVEDWNDASGRTQAEVVDCLRRAAATLRSEP